MKPELPHDHLVVAAWIGGSETDAIRAALADALSGLDRPWRLRPALFDGEGLEVFVDGRSEEDVGEVRDALADACARVAGATIDGQWTFLVD